MHQQPHAVILRVATFVCLSFMIRCTYALFLPINLLFFSESCKPKDNSTHTLKSKVDTEILGLKMLRGGEKSPSAQSQQIWLVCQLPLSHHSMGNILGEGTVQNRSAKGKQSFGSGHPSVVYKP